MDYKFYILRKNGNIMKSDTLRFLAFPAIFSFSRDYLPKWNNLSDAQRECMMHVI